MTEQVAPGPCPVCGNTLIDPKVQTAGRDAHEYNCARCGRFGLDDFALVDLEARRAADPQSLFLLSHLLWRMRGRRDIPFLDNPTIENLLSENDPPSAVEQLQNLVIYLGDQAKAPGQRHQVLDNHDRAAVGALSADNFYWLLRQAIDQGYLDGTTHNQGFTGALSWKGWELYQELKHGRAESNRGFMAMPFGDPRLDDVFGNCFRPAARDAGFGLFRLDEQPRAGSIDDRLRIEIRRSRFLIADLTDGNHGAYWEAGFAEGLGLPVIYSCEETYFRDPGTHFDTSHMHTVIWNAANLQDAAKKLRITLRSTFPEEAVFEDDPDAAV